MKPTHKKNLTTIDVNDILQILSQNNFSNQKQVELLKILDYALVVKNYPNNIHEIIHRKIQLLEQSQDLLPTESTTVSQKSRSVVILEMLNEMGIGLAVNDRTKICRLIAYLTNGSYKCIYRKVQKGIIFSEYHAKEIAEVNKIFKELNSSISISMNKEY
jgi:hypothetical protein